MSRIKLQYAPSEITTDLYTYGKQWMTDDDNIEYIGLYHQYTTGEIYTQPTYSDALSKKLIPYEIINTINAAYKKLKPNLKTKFKTIYPVYQSVTQEDINRGYLTRYFAYRQTDSVIIEIDLIQYDAIGSNISDSNLYSPVKLNWYITGPIDDVQNGIVKTNGVRTNNRMSIYTAEKTAPSIGRFLRNLTEFYMDTDFKVPADINV